mgnify:CR=1 FL=1
MVEARGRLGPLGTARDGSGRSGRSGRLGTLGTARSGRGVEKIELGIARALAGVAVASCCARLLAVAVGRRALRGDGLAVPMGLVWARGWREPDAVLRY